MHTRRGLIVAGLCLSLTASVMAGLSSSAQAAAEPVPVTGPVAIDNGTIQLGVNPKGHLNASIDGVGASSGGTGPVGLRYLPTNAEATAPGCLCEGWGAADASTGLTGYANESEGTANLIEKSFVADATRAVSTVLIPNSGGTKGLLVKQDYHPFSGSQNLYEDTVTITNTTATTLTDVRYRRVMDWDIEPTAFAEYSTIAAAKAVPFGNVLFTSDDGFASSDPLVARTSILETGLFENSGPDDHGALFDFGFGALAAGKSLTFNIYYGAAANRSDAVAAAVAAKAEIYSLGSSTDSSPDLGTPNTFVFAFSGIGGSGVSGTDPRPPLSLSVFDRVLTASTAEISALLSNPTIANATGVSTTLTLPPGSPLALLSGPPTQIVGTVNAGDSTSRSWTVSVPNSCTDQTYPYTVTARFAGDGGDARRVDTELRVPAATCASVPTITARDVTVTSGSTFSGVLGSGTSGALPAKVSGTAPGRTYGPVTVTTSSFTIDAGIVTIPAPVVSATRTFPYTVKITDANGRTATATGSFTVLAPGAGTAPPSITTARDITLVSGQKFSGLLAEGTSGTLPARVLGVMAGRSYGPVTVRSSTFVVDSSVVSYTAPRVRRRTVFPYTVAVVDADGRTATRSGRVIVLPL